MAKRISVVISQSQSQNPARRQLEEDLVGGLIMEPGIDVVVVPHLYDLGSQGTGALALQGLSGNVILLSWLYDRAARWVLDRLDVRGQAGISLIKPPKEEDEEDEEELEAAKAEADEKTRVADTRPMPNRRIYCVDLRIHASARKYIDEIKRIAGENAQQVVSLDLGGMLGGSPSPAQQARFQNPTNTTALDRSGDGKLEQLSATERGAEMERAAQVVRIEEAPDRRWYPVIDYSRCTNCMECIDFCLFGVYGVDKVDTILVEQPDNCRKGCPACSRVCPENAIIFPQHKTPGIAGADVSAGGTLKIDLSRLFGAPETGEDAAAIAARERDEQLVAVGREAVGMSVGMPKRQADKPVEAKDELDSLIDQLDSLDL
jgi:NAD-dependent dihydropyrimidine dehydrogenase PreA subunit